VGAAFVNIGMEKNGFLYLNDTVGLVNEEDVDVAPGSGKRQRRRP
jgi:Ribonuclease G/E